MINILAITLKFICTNTAASRPKHFTTCEIIGIKSSMILRNYLIEIPEENGLDWYYFGARYYDPAIGRFLSVDRFADKYPSLTPYHYAANNPVLIIDINGDTITVSEALAEREEWKSWRNSEEGKAFFKAYKAGGKRGTTNVSFSLRHNFLGIEISSKWGASTIISKSPGCTTPLKDGKEVEALMTGIIGSGGIDKNHDPDPNSVYRYAVEFNPFVDGFHEKIGNEGYFTISHEVDHVIYMDSQVRKGETILHPSKQHEPDGPVPQGQGGKQIRLLMPAMFNKKNN